MSETAHTPLTFDHSELRRGFLDVHTPISAMAELQLTPDEQRKLLDTWVKELEVERAELAVKIHGSPIHFRLKKNINNRMKRKPSYRKALRADKAADRYVMLGRRIQELQRMSGEIRRAQQSDAKVKQ